MSQTKNLVKQAEAAKLLGISPALLTRRKKQGKIVMNGDLVDLQATQDLTESEGESETFSQAQTRREIALADKYELENRVREGELVNVALASSAWLTAAQKVRDPLLAMPDEAAPILAALTDVRQIRDELGNRIRQILSNLSVQLHDRTDTEAA